MEIARFCPTTFGFGLQMHVPATQPEVVFRYGSYLFVDRGA